jgi:hypothetical protein
LTILELWRLPLAYAVAMLRRHNPKIAAGSDVSLSAPHYGRIIKAASASAASTESSEYADVIN